jgi:hypothetical protein
MRALLLRRTAFLAVLGSGLALTASAVHGVSGMGRELELAAVSQERPAFVHDRPDCDRWREPARRV